MRSTLVSQREPASITCHDPSADSAATAVDPGCVLRAIAICALLVATARAEPDITGFVAYGAGTLSGRVTDAEGKPLAGVQVHAVSKSGGDHAATTDRHGSYRLELAGGPGEPSMVYVHDQPGARLDGAIAASMAAGSDGEAIAVDALIPPAVMPKPTSSPLAIPEYSDAAIDKNAWAKAWLLLDIDATGAVTRVKFLKRPGFELDPIALRTAFALAFEPARDHADRPVRALMLWSFEWPSYFWMQKLHQELRNGVPAFVTQVPCQRPNEYHPEFRDCSGPDLARAGYESWVVPRRR